MNAFNIAPSTYFMALLYLKMHKIEIHFMDFKHRIKVTIAIIVLSKDFIGCTFIYKQKFDALYSQR